jgi:NAD(P)-dependent dehydrogenase (short-subunit alcohol dehydrogenase family)
MLGVVGAGCGVAAALMRRRENFDLRGKVVLITGGSRGLGLAMARDFAAAGARLALCAREPAELRAATDDLRSCTSEVLGVPCDVGDPEQVENMINAVMQHYGRIDVLVNNAGVMQVGPLHTMTLADFEHAMEVIYWGVVHTTLAALPHILKGGEGRIVNITSIGGKVSVPHMLPYSCAKFATVAFSEGLRAELAGTGVKTVTIAPGLMRTGSFLNASFKGNNPNEAKWFSVSASLPGISISAKRASASVVAATKRGTADKVLGGSASMLAIFHGLFPGLTADVLGLIKQALPDGRGAQDRLIKPVIQRSMLLKGLTVLGQRAARRYLQMGARTA